MIEPELAFLNLNPMENLHSQLLDDLPAQELAKLIVKYGSSLCDDPQRCEALLRDYCGQHRREVSLLVDALNEQVPAELLSSQGKIPAEVIRARLVKKLVEDRYLAEAPAQWAVDSWIRALGVDQGSEQELEKVIGQRLGKEMLNKTVVESPDLKPHFPEEKPDGIKQPRETNQPQAEVLQEQSEAEMREKRSRPLNLSLWLGLGVALIGVLGIGGWLAGSAVINLISGRQSQQNQDSGLSGIPLATFTEIKNIPSGRFNYGGSTTFAPIRSVADPEMEKMFPQFMLRYVDPISGTPGSGKGIAMLLEGQLSFSQSSRSLKDKEYQEAKNRGFKLKQIPVAIDGIAIAVNPTLQISGITLAQLKDIYTGKITNWNQVGGSDLKITPYTRSLKDGGTIEFFHEHVLDKENFGPNVKLVYGTTIGIRLVSKNPGGIYYASAPEVVPQCSIKTLAIGKRADKLISPAQEPQILPQQCSSTQRNRLNEAALKAGDYPITRQLFVIVKQDGQTDQRAGEAYAELLLTRQGQDLVEKAGFVTIR